MFSRNALRVIVGYKTFAAAKVVLFWQMCKKKVTFFG